MSTLLSQPLQRQRGSLTLPLEPQAREATARNPLRAGAVVNSQTALSG